VESAAPPYRTPYIAKLQTDVNQAFADASTTKTTFTPNRDGLQTLLTATGRRNPRCGWSRSRLASLLRGIRYEEALALTLVLLVFWRARPSFDRRTAFFDARFSTGWLVAIAGVLGASVWIGLFAFRHVEYSNELWWQFGLDAQASRFLRGSIGAAVLLLLMALARLLAAAAHEATGRNVRRRAQRLEGDLVVARRESARARGARSCSRRAARHRLRRRQATNHTSTAAHHEDTKEHEDHEDSLVAQTNSVVSVLFVSS
jgi:hypothetical protein